MEPINQYDVIIIGGSYAGLAAAMSLGRALKKTLIIDGNQPCNRQTPYSHNFLTRDGSTPKEIADIAKEQLKPYQTVELLTGIAISAKKTGKGFEVTTGTKETFTAKKLIFATGIKEEFPDIEGISACWGVSVLHCPYCHGYEVKGVKTAILGSGQGAYEMAMLISNWTTQLTVFTNGTADFTPAQLKKSTSHNITINEKPIQRLDHSQGKLQQIVFADGTTCHIKAIYTKNPFIQHCPLPRELGCEPTEEGYIKVGPDQQTTVEGIYACGDSTSKLRTVANAVSSGTTAGMMASKQLIMEQF